MEKLSKILLFILLILSILSVIEGVITGNAIYFLSAFYIVCITVIEILDDELIKMKDKQIKSLRNWGDNLLNENISLMNKLSIYRVPLKAIKVPQSFKEHPPAVSKLSHRFNYYDKHKEFQVPIIVDNNLNLVDGYTSYLIAKKRKLNIVEVKFK